MENQPPDPWSDPTLWPDEPEPHYGDVLVLIFAVLVGGWWILSTFADLAGR